jgi:hypothetical protein
LEYYHQDSLENGSRIRDKLSEAVTQAIECWAQGFINHPKNREFAQNLSGSLEKQKLFYDDLLTLVYRILFLLTIEERNLTHPEETNSDLKEIYRNYYSLGGLRKRCRESDYRDEEKQYGDLWDSLCDTFKLYEESGFGGKLGVSPLGSDLFSLESFDRFRDCYLDNASFARGFEKFDSYYDEKRKLQVYINYAALNVEEFGSIYEGLLDFEAGVSEYDGHYSFQFIKSQNRDKSGSHYTPEELVQPLIEHALMPLIKDTLKSAEPEKALLNLKICDDACGSGHILLNAARRIALELARLRTKEDNPNPASYRKALREVIEHCIYGVDANPQAVRLCKVALWLESHNPGVSLGFLDHHIKCGDSLLGLIWAEELLEGIPIEAFDKLEGDDGEYLNHVRKAHKREKEEIAAGQIMASWRQKAADHLDTVISRLNMVMNMPDSTVELADLKKEHYLNLINSSDWIVLKTLADIKMAPFFIAKKPGAQFATESLYRGFLDGKLGLRDHPVAEKAESLAAERRFFHWFLEFAEVMQDGGFDCFLGNPPFLGGQKISGFFGKNYLEYLKYAYTPAGAMDIVGFFVRRNYSLIKQERALGTLATNTIAQGGTREGGLEVIEKSGGSVIMAVKSRPWPGAAAVSVSLAAIYKGQWQGTRSLDGKDVPYISTYFTAQMDIGNPYPLAANMDKSFQGSIVLGKGFVLTPEEADRLIAANPKNKDVLFPYLNGEDLNSRSDQSPSRWVINFKDWPLNRETAEPDYKGPVAADYPDCLAIVERLVKPERLAKNDNDGAITVWWQFLRPRSALYRTIAPLEKILVHTRVTKTHAFSFVNKNAVFSDATVVMAFEDNACFVLLNSSIHEYWAWKYSSTMKGDRRYSPSDAFETFPFPPGLEQNNPRPVSPYLQRLDALGENLDSSRSETMRHINIGLTKLYNLYHKQGLTKDAIIKESKCGAADAEWALEQIIRLRDMQREIDEAVRDSYGWTDMPLRHGFYELEFLPENDRIRYTVCDSARRQILQELLKLNHERHKEELAAGLVDENGKAKKNKGKKEKTVNKGPELWKKE